MAIDTPFKRKGVLGAGVTGVFALPAPDGTIDASNRRQLTDSYPLTALIIPRSGWSKDHVSADSWVPDDNPTNTWVPDTVTTEIWVPDQEIAEV